MNPADIIARVKDVGWRVELEKTGPKLVPELGHIALPDQLLSDLKLHKAAIIQALLPSTPADIARYLIGAQMLARAGERKQIWGLVSGDPEAKQAKGRKVLDSWNYVAVEGDAEWTPLPKLPKRE